MFTHPPVWLYADELINSYNHFCQYNEINQRRIIKLFDSFLLCGTNDRNAKKVKILKESFDDLIVLAGCNSKLKIGTKNSEIILPDYLKHKYPVQYDGPLSWFSCRELLAKYSAYVIQVRKMNCLFIGELIRMGLLIGQYSSTEKCYLVNSESWHWLMKFHEHIVGLYKMLPSI